MGFIYKITNVITNKIYIGKTERNIKIRWKEHLKNSKKLSHLPLYRAILKYGASSFIIEEVEQCNQHNIDEREQYWINYYDTYNNGYNCTLGGEGSLLHIPEEEIITIIKRYQMGERLDLLCKEYHHDYMTIKEIFNSRNIIINTNAGPAKLSKQIYAINPITLQVECIYPSISAAARDLCEEGKNYKAIINHISKYKDTSRVSHGYLWKTKILEKEVIFDEDK